MAFPKAYTVSLLFVHSSAQASRMVQAAKLSQDMIVDAAIAQMREGGLASVSLRNVAHRLSARAPSLARHVGDKQRLVALMSAQLFGEALDSIDRSLTGDRWLLAYGHALRRKQAEFSDISLLIAQAPAIPDIDVATLGKLEGLMKDAGLTGDLAHAQQEAIQALVTGWMVFEHSSRRVRGAAGSSSDERFSNALTALIGGFREA